jgi:hypothetical protein
MPRIMLVKGGSVDGRFHCRKDNETWGIESGPCTCTLKRITRYHSCQMVKVLERGDCLHNEKYLSYMQEENKHNNIYITIYTCTNDIYMYKQYIHVQTIYTGTNDIYMYKRYLHVQTISTCTHDIYMYKQYIHVQTISTCTNNIYMYKQYRY